MWVGRDSLVRGLHPLHGIFAKVYLKLIFIKLYIVLYIYELRINPALVIKINYLSCFLCGLLEQEPVDVDPQNLHFLPSLPCMCLPNGLLEQEP